MRAKARLLGTVDLQPVDTMEREWFSSQLQEHSPDLISQQNGAPLHSHNAVTSYYNEQISIRWIGRRGSKEWYPRLPDLPLIDFFL